MVLEELYLKRCVYLSLFLIGLDQFLKLLCKEFLENKTILFSKNFGLTYTKNSGTWLNPNISNFKYNMLIIMGTLFPVSPLTKIVLS